MAYAVYIQNRCPTRVLDSITYEEAWSGRRPYIAYICVLGYVVFAMVLDEKNVNSMQMVPNVCVWIIMKELKPIG